VRILSITSNQLYSSAKFLASVFAVLSENRVIVDLVSTSDASISVAINESVTSRKIDAAIQKLNVFSAAQVLPERAILSLIGQNMHHKKGVAARMFTCLAEAGVNIEMITQGASEVNVSCVVSESQVDHAMSAVHKGLCIP